MREIGEPVPESWIIEDPKQLGGAFSAHQAPWPLIVRPAYTLGGTGGGIARTPTKSCWRSATGAQALHAASGHGGALSARAGKKSSMR